MSVQHPRLAEAPALRGREAIDRGAALLGAAVIVLASLRYLAGLAKILDPAMSMEPFYIDLARHGVAEILSMDPAWGALYALWLKPWRAQLADPILVYAANVHVLSFFLPLATYLYVLVLTRRAAVATGTALFLLVSDLNVPLSSKVCVFALVVVLFGLALSELSHRDDRRTAVVAAAALLASYARPELYPAGVCLWLGAIWLARRDLRNSEPSSLAWAVGGTVLIAVATWWLGTPLWSAHHEGGRLVDAFREHFAWNWPRWNDASEFYLTIWEREFGIADSITAALLNNPTAVARHVLENVKGFFPVLFGSMFDHYPVLLPAAPPALATAEAFLLAIVLAACLVRVWTRRALREELWQRYAHAFTQFLLLSIFPIGGALVIYPTPHYVIVPAFCLVIAGVLALSLALPRITVSSWSKRILLSLVVLAIVPTPFVLPTDYFTPGRMTVGNLDARRDVTDTVRRIRALNLPPPVQVLTFTDGIGELLGDGYHERKIWQRGDRSLKEYLEQEGIDVIVTFEPGRYSFHIQDPYWQIIQLEPEKTGFTPVTAPDAVGRIWVRTALMRE